MNIQETLDFIKSNGIEMVNFMYPAADGRLKTLNFTVNDDDYLQSILRYGERVDGSSLFPFIGAGNSDLYVIPRLGPCSSTPSPPVPRHVSSAPFSTRTATGWTALRNTPW